LVLSLNSKVELNNGVQIPRLGFGTWELARQSVIEPVKWALEKGIRLIDTASIYANEKYVGKAIKDSKIPRDEIFVTSKVWNTDQGYEKTLKAFDDSLGRLELSYLDLYLIHWPNKLSTETWKALEQIYKDGRTKAIGVSNFTIKDLEKILKDFKIVPVLNQIKMHPLKLSENKNLIDFCQERDIKIEAYSPLTHGENIGHHKFMEIAEKYNKTVPQILIRWSIQKGFICIPRSSNKDHIEQNVNIFDFHLSEKDMTLLDFV